ncbi:MAG TPA: COX15/CtaA family protein, partial [Gemmataceae bacterium]|nr:COX15/CtaA family protein [Gemmataceae bacterium]
GEFSGRKRERERGRLLTTTGPSRWLHYWAILTVAAAAPLLFFGAEVTTRGVGMADPMGFRLPWELAGIGSTEGGLGLTIEHIHRLAGFVVGFCAILLVCGLWLRESRRWVRRLGLLALAGVIVQGLLGKFRVDLHAMFGPNLALIHGIFGQVVFALLASVAVLTSRPFAAEPESAVDEPEARSVRRGALLLTGLVLAQLVFGAILRHQGSALGQRAHLLTAFVVAATVTWLVVRVLGSKNWDRGVVLAVKLLAGLVVVQLVLGVETWMIKASTPIGSMTQANLLGRDLVRSAHVLVGALILGSSMAVTLVAHRRSVLRLNVTPVRTLEDAA